jgi:hypothetical protein
MDRRRIVLIVIAVALLLLVLLLRVALQPEHATRLILDQAGKALGLEITASSGEYRLRGTPQLVLHGVVAREPGATPLLRAKRIYLSLPWSTVRARGSDLTVRRVELDAPRFNLPAYQHWIGTRPPSARRIPTLTDGLRIRDGRIENDDWNVDGIDADLPSLHPDRPAQARLRARYLDPPVTIPVDLAVALSHPSALATGAATGFATRGRITIERGDWRLPATIALSGPLQLGKDDLRITPAHLGLAARYESGKTALPFTLGLHGPLRFDEATWLLAPVGVALHGQGPLPTFNARGALALGRRLVLQLDGRIAQWPETWPALPAPIGQSTSELPFVLHYIGRPDLSEIAALHLERDATVFDGRFRLPVVLAWIDAKKLSPLPPLDGHVTTPRMEISGAQLEGVEVTVDDAALPDDHAQP